MFKLQHPQDLISRLFILEYMREIGAEALYAKANKHQKGDLFYKYTDDEGKEFVDVNWEACLFEATIPQLDFFLKNFLEEIEKIEAKRNEQFRAQREQMLQEQISTPVDINLMDLAQTEIDKNNSGKILGTDGQHLN